MTPLQAYAAPDPSLGVPLGGPPARRPSSRALEPHRPGCRPPSVRGQPREVVLDVHGVTERVDATIQLCDRVRTGQNRIATAPRLTEDAPSQGPGVEEDAATFVGEFPVDEKQPVTIDQGVR